MKKSFFRKSLKDWFKAFVIALIIAIIVRAFFFQSYTISSTNMESTLLAGDYVFVNKFKYGARFPITLLSLPFSESASLNWIELPYWRLPGYSDVEREDILVFNYPAENDKAIDKKNIYAKRCIGLPGDTLKIKNKKININGESLENSDGVQLMYRVVAYNKELDEKLLKKYNIHEGGVVSEAGIYDFPLSKKTADSLLKEEIIDTVRVLRDYMKVADPYVFPQNNSYRWNKDNFGPLLIPKSGLNIELTEKNLPLYQRIIEVYEDNTLEVNAGKIYINNQLVSSYTFQYDYFFVMDDNRDLAKDSRHFGFVPEHHIIGTVSFIWYSVDKNDTGEGNVRWNRVFSSAQ